MHISLQTHQENQSLSFSEFKRDSYVCAFTLNGYDRGRSDILHHESAKLADKAYKLAPREQAVSNLLVS